MNIDKSIYDGLYKLARDLESQIWKMETPCILTVDGTTLPIHKLLSVFIAPQYADGRWALFMDIEYKNNSGSYVHKRDIFTSIDFGLECDEHVD